MKSWSCSDLHYSLYLAPNKIRTCCQRFFVDGEIQGDVELLTIDRHESAQSILDLSLLAKQNLYLNINNGEKTKCYGCPKLTYQEWPEIERLDIKHLSLEYHSICNLKCTYCSDVYYGGLNPNYDISDLIKKMYTSSMLDNCNSIVWGGGEPLADRNFSILLQYLVENINAKYRVFTNAIKYSELLEKLISSDLASITTSIDAGTRSTYSAVRGKDKLDFVIKNLKKYSSRRPENIIIKYIFTDEKNQSLSEIKSFISLMKENKLHKCCFQISCDYFHEDIPKDQLVSMIIMYSLIRNEINATVFFDDLLWHRMSKTFKNNKLKILKSIDNFEIPNVLAKYDGINSVVVWGAGSIAKNLVNYSNFFDNMEIENFVDSNYLEIESPFCGKEVLSPETLLDSDAMIVISAALNYPSILKDFSRLGIDEKRIINGLII